MERHRLTAAQAFAALTRTPRTANVKLRDMADELVVTGALDARHVDPIS